MSVGAWTFVSVVIALSLATSQRLRPRRNAELAGRLNQAAGNRVH